MNQSIKKVVTKDNRPIQIKGSFSNDYTRRYFRDFEIPTIIELTLLTPNAPFSESNNHSKAEPLRFTCYCPICHEPNEWNATECKHCHIKRKSQVSSIVIGVGCFLLPANL